MRLGLIRLRRLEMKTYTFSGGSLGEGITLKQDDKFGLVVYLGEAGRGRRYEKVALSRKSAPEVRDSRVFDAEPVKIPVPAQGNKAAMEFWVLSKSQKPADGSVLVHVDTEGTYTRDSSGSWKTIAGNPETVVSGYGAYGDAGRIGNWDDGLVIMRPGDALRVKRSGGHKNRPDALFFDADGKLTSMDFEEWQALQAIETFEETKVESNEKPVNVLYGTMPAFSFTRDTGWKLERGIGTTTIGTGHGFQLGPKDDSWRSFTRKTIMASEGFPEIVAEAAVAKSGENLVLVKSGNAEFGKFLVRLSTQGYSKGGYTSANIIRGDATILIRATMDHGTANPVHHEDMVIVLASGDVVRIGQRDESYGGYVLCVENGQLKSDDYFAWELRDAKRDPAPYIAKGICPIDCMPESWVGKVILPQDAEHGYAGQTMGVTSIKPEVLLNMEWERLTPYEGNPNINPWQNMIWAKLTDQVMNAEAHVLSTEEKIEFDEPILPLGTQIKAHVIPSDGHYRIIMENVPAHKFTVTRYEKSGQTFEDKQTAGDVKTTFEYDSSKYGYQIYCRDGVVEGDYAVEITTGTGKGGRTLGYAFRVLGEWKEVNEPTMDIRVYMGKSRRDPSVLWVIAKDGSIFAQSGESGEVNLVGIPQSALAIRWQTSNYGYAYMEEWEVHHMPAELTDAQRNQVALLEPGCHKHFVGQGTGWSDKVGIVRFEQSYRNMSDEDHSAMSAQHPISVKEWGAFKAVKQDSQRWVDPEHPIVRWIEVAQQPKIK